MSRESTIDPELHDAAVLRVRELEAAHEISQAFLSASQPIEVYRLALVRLTPMVRADFAAVFLRDESDSRILKPVAAQGWPQSSARYLGRLRIRVGAGPTGRAVAEGRPLEVEDIFGDDGLSAWWEPARELGFAAMITLPLTTEGEPNDSAGALSFYFVEPRTFSSEERRLLMLIAQQLGATSRRAAVVADLRAEADRMRKESEALARRVRDEEARALAHDQLLLGVTRDLARYLGTAHAEATEWGATVPASTAAGIETSLAMTADLVDFLRLRLGYPKPSAGAEDAGHLAREAVQAAGPVPAHVHFTLEVDDTLHPVTTDGAAVIRALTILLQQAYRHTARGAINLSVQPASDGTNSLIEWLIRVRGLGIESGSDAARREPASPDPAAGRGAESLALALAGETAAVLGGSLTAETEPGIATLFRFRLPSRHEAGS